MTKIMSSKQFKSKMLKAEILEMISNIEAEEVELLQAIEYAIIDTQAEHYYSQLATNGFIKETEN